MSQRTLDDKVRAHVWLNRHDLDRIAIFFPKQKQSEVVRTLLKKVLDIMEADAGRKRRPTPTTEDPIL